MNCQEDLEAAAALLLLHNGSPPDRPPSAENHLRSADPQPPAISFEKTSTFIIPPWGIRSRRSSCVCKAKRGREEYESLSAAAEGACNRPSPTTPLDFGGISSDPSTSGCESFHTSSDIPPIKRLCAGEASPLRSVVDTKVSAVERSALVEAVVTASKPIRRQGRKKTISELQAQESSLKEEKTILMKLVESRRKDMETLMVENQRLKCEMTSFQRARSATEPANPAFLLPDLNEPVLMESLET
ncbi:hypothetical protein M5K25_024739 [Dendrobium thyrsiflorum]|uniref:BZIP domain-containing protein n=1 Tax=Dendrobium thyrsiflorum TaxID=117978 RepID=A0ABD0U2R6_DENTH